MCVTSLIQKYVRNIELVELGEYRFSLIITVKECYYAEQGYTLRLLHKIM